MKSPRHFLGMKGVSLPFLIDVLDTAQDYYDAARREHIKLTHLRGKTIINVFFESSTRTRTSFEIAGKRLSADVINISTASSSVTKGETLLDTVKTLEAMNPDAVIIRHSASGAPHYVAERLDTAVINAGDGAHEHPTQALLDAYTMRKHCGRLHGLVIAICGDVLHSRVARSNAILHAALGNEVRFVGPRTLLPPAEVFGARAFDSLEAGLAGADVVMVLRIQRERLEGERRIASLREYSRHFGISERSLRAANPNAIVMHPGPMNRGVEISSDVADGPRSLVLEQVEAGVAVRMALLKHMLATEAAA